MLIQFKQTLRGYMLLESLIAFLVASFGVLGLLAMQAFLHARQVESQLRIQASMYANELISMAAADAANAGCYVIPVNTQTGCASATARNFAQTWENEVQNQFPSANTFTPTAVLAGGNDFTVTIFWRRNNDNVTHNHRAVTNIGS